MKIKKASLTLLVLIVALKVFGQDSKEPKVKLQGGLWSGTNGKVTMVGIPAAKLSATFSLSEKTKLETGVMLIPGIIIDKAGERFGLSAGGTVTLRKSTLPVKPILGVVVLRTDTWQLMPGIGFIF